MMLQCYVDEETLKWLAIASSETGRKIEELAEAAISEATIAFKVNHRGLALPSQKSAPVFKATHHSRDTGEGDPAVTPDCAGADTCPHGMSSSARCSTCNGY